MQIRQRKTKKYIVILLSAIFALAQFCMIRHYWFYAGWDAGYVWRAAQGDIDPVYFSIYPNNLFLVFLYRSILRIATSAGFWEGYGYLILIAVQCVLCQTAAVLTYLCAEDLSDSKSAFWTFAAFEILIGLSPWISVPYSDASGLVFPILIYFISVKNIRYKWSIIGFLSYIAFSIKPQAAIIAIAVVLIKLRNPKQLLYLILGIVLSVGLVSSSVESLNARTDDEKSMGAAHYLMMGLNERTTGAWAEEDVLFSESIQSKGERNREDLNRALERVREFGTAGTIRHLLKKTAYFLSDGTFSWFGEGNFVYAYNEENGKTLRNIYYEDGEYYKIWSCAVSIVWYLCVALLIAGLFFRKNKNVKVLYLAFLGILAFNALFEQRARYIFVNVPLVLLLASVALYKTEKWIEQKKKHLETD